MLRELKVQNFKSIASSELPLSDINVLVGENGSGKSSFLQALIVLKQSLDNPTLRLSGAILDLGEFGDVLHRPGSSEEITLWVVGTLAVPESLGREVMDKEATIQFNTEWSANSSRLVRMRSQLKLGSAEIGYNWNWMTGGQPSSTNISFLRMSFAVGANAVIGGGPQQQSQQNPANMAIAQVQQVSNLFTFFLSAPRTALRQVFLVPSLRGIERQSYDLGDGASVDFASPEGTFKTGQALATTILYRRELEDRISSWMSRVTGRSLQGRAVAPRKVSLDAVAHGQRVNIVNEGFGSNQLAQVLTQLATLPADSTLAIEEPEIHLHPAAQARLVSVLVEAVLAGHSQLLLTTQSEHILYALMALVGEGTLKPEQVVVHHVANEEGATVLHRLELDSTGRIAGGIPGFFDAHVEEFRRFLEAAEKHHS